MALTEYVYENTPTLQHEDDKLRQIVVAGVAEHLDDLVSYSMFNDLIGRGGLFVQEGTTKTIPAASFRTTSMMRGPLRRM